MGIKKQIQLLAGFLIGFTISGAAVSVQAEEQDGTTFRDNGLANQQRPTIPLGYHFVSMSEWSGDYIGFEGAVEGSSDHSAVVVNVPMGGQRGAYVAAAFADSGTHYGGLKGLVDGERIVQPVTMPWDMAFGYDTFSGHDDEFDFSKITNLVAGISLSRSVRFEGEVSYLQHDVDVFRSFVLSNQDLDGSVSTLRVDLDGLLVDNVGRVRTKTSFANAIFDLPLKHGHLTSFMGAGVGLAEVDIDYAPNRVSIVNESKMAFAHQFMVGASYRPNLDTELVLNARYRGMVSGDFIDPNMLLEGFSVKDENIVGEVGFRRNF
ncbi:MAG: hypothetical protein AAF986_02995 [Pseudomonadota bacterium]